MSDSSVIVREPSLVDEQPLPIRIRGARVHNLRNVDVDIPRNRFVVVTGPSGSGKSSLAFDTLYAEGQRQYIESLSTYARQFLDQMERPDVDLVEGLQPTICIDQRPGSQNPRSTVATATEVYDYLRLLLARVGQVHCFQCGTPVAQQTAEEIQQRILQLGEGTKMMILAVMVRGRRGSHKDVLAKIRQAGFVRARIDGVVRDLDDVPELSPRQVHDIDAVVDRIVLRAGIESRVAESVDLATQHGNGTVVACYHCPASSDQRNAAEWKDEVFSTRYACPQCNVSFEELEPRTFSFNSPYGACPVCDGLGSRTEFDPDLIVPDPGLSAAEGAVAPWRTKANQAGRQHLAEVVKFAQAHGHSEQQPLSDMSANLREQLFFGDNRSFSGIVMLLERELATTTSRKRIAQLENYRSELPCQACHASRLRKEAMNVLFCGKAIHEITAMSVKHALEFFGESDYSSVIEEVAAPLVAEIANRLAFLQKVGLGYLSLNRSADTLSGGEFQRVRLATSIGSGLVGVCYVLDEPSIGLHPRDNQRLIDALRELQFLGNTVLVVEHDETIMRQADYLIDIGPGAGEHGGRIVAQGTPGQVSRNSHSLTGKYLSRMCQISIPGKRRRLLKSRSLVLEDATVNNLKSASVQIPLQAFVCVTGVSGSGKSSLVNQTLAPALSRRLGQSAPKPGPHRSLRGVNQLDRVVQIDAASLGRTPRSNPATYCGVFDEIRKVFAGTRQARQRGYGVARFSFNNKQGRCDACQGQGMQRLEMSFLPDLFVICDECHGARFNRQTLRVRYRDRSIADVLAMRVDEAAEFFVNFERIHRVLASLQQVGLGYLPLGQPSTTLSGGEAQRVKLASELSRVDTGSTLYVLDEPTTGLHFEDIRRLVDVLQALVERGNSVIVIEHNLDVMKCADWIIDMGPEGGENGGVVVASGTPEEIARLEENHTGRCLKAAISIAVAS